MREIGPDRYNVPMTGSTPSIRSDRAETRASDAVRGGAKVALRALTEAQSLLTNFMADPANTARIDAVGHMLAERFSAGHKVLVCGNGGSVCDAMHFAEELTGRFRKDRRPLPALACADAGHITCVANDFGFEDIFARWVDALGNAGDVLIALSTSGDSRNVLCAVAKAKEKGMHTVGLLGKYGGMLRGQCDHEWIVTPPDGMRVLYSDRIQEIHMLVLHTLIEVVERELFPENYASV